MTVISSDISPDLRSPMTTMGKERLQAVPRIVTFTRAETANDPTKAALYEGFLDLRKKYSEQEHWEPKEEEGKDFYDRNPQTRFVIVCDDKGEVSAGARFTPVANLQNSMSFGEMWEGPITRQQPRAVKGLWDHLEILSDLDEEAKKKGTVWDLTRLMTRGSLKENGNTIQSFKDIQRLIGAGLAVTGEDSVWIFTTTVGLKSVLDKVQLPSAAVMTDRITPDIDEQDCTFCIAKPGEATRYQREKSPRNSQFVSAGYAAVKGYFPTEELPPAKI